MSLVPLMTVREELQDEFALVGARGCRCAPSLGMQTNRPNMEVLRYKCAARRPSIWMGLQSCRLFFAG
jgi:hypothetical protein